MSIIFRIMILFPHKERIFYYSASLLISDMLLKMDLFINRLNVIEKFVDSFSGIKGYHCLWTSSRSSEAMRGLLHREFKDFLRPF